MAALKIIVTALMAAALWGCAQSSTTAGYEARLSSLKGLHIDEVVKVWGPPQGSFIFDDGRRVYSFVKYRLVTMPRMLPGFAAWRRFAGPGYYGGGFYGRDIREYYCETKLTTDPEGRISEWAFKGNSCRARPPEMEEAQTPATQERVE